MMACLLCGDGQSASSGLFVNESWAGKWQSACDHGACGNCLKEWIAEELPACRENHQLRVQCFAPGCAKTLSQKLVLHISSAAEEFADELDKRFQLESNLMYPETCRVNCPKKDCVGLGYQEFGTLMCFLCEYQWPAQAGHGLDLQHAGFMLPENVRPCPRCDVLIEKDGGCDHITCSQCGFDFLWSTMGAWNPDFVPVYPEIYDDFE